MEATHTMNDTSNNRSPSDFRADEILHSINTCRAAVTKAKWRAFGKGLVQGFGLGIAVGSILSALSFVAWKVF